MFTKPVRVVVQMFLVRLPLLHNLNLSSSTTSLGGGSSINFQASLTNYSNNLTDTAYRCTPVPQLPTGVREVLPLTNLSSFFLIISNVDDFKTEGWTCKGACL